MIITTLAVVAYGCKDISEFSTGPGESYCGQIVPGGSFRAGFAPGVRLRLHLDTERIQDAPGDLATDDGRFFDAPLRPIPELSHDSLSTLDFGEGRIRNLLYGIKPESGAVAYVVISLLDNGNVEARILRGAPPTAGEPPSTEEHGRDLFGVFPLTRQRGTCGF